MPHRHPLIAKASVFQSALAWKELNADPDPQSAPAEAVRPPRESRLFSDLSQWML